MSTVYDSTPVVGYSDGVVHSTVSPERITINGNPNDWFTIGDKRYNVHPYDSHIGGYPVRWIESL